MTIVIKYEMTRKHSETIKYIKFRTILLGSFYAIPYGQTDGLDHNYKQISLISIIYCHSFAVN